MPDHVGQQLGNYRLLRLIHEDPVTETYLGSAQTGSPVAITVARYSPDQTTAELFIAHASRIAKLNHPHIVPVLAYGEAASTVYLASDYASQTTMRQIYKPGQQVELAQVMHLVLQIAAALEYIHKRGITHGDLRPENLFFGPQQTVLLSNFSLPALSAKASIRAKNPYMAPEQLQGETRPASDQYALGVMIYEWLSGSPPSDNNSEAMPLSIQVQQVSTDIEYTIMRALEKDWRARFESVGAFLAALEQAMTITAVGKASLLPITEVASPRAASQEKTIIPGPQGIQANQTHLNAPPAPSEAGREISVSKPYDDLLDQVIQYPIYAPVPAGPVIAIPIYAPPKPPKPIHFPLTRKAPAYKQILACLLYSAAMALSILGSILYLIRAYDPNVGTPIYTYPDGSVNVLSIVLTVVLIIFIVPACSILCGTFFGSWKGFLVSLCSIAGGILLISLNYPPLWQAPMSLLTFIPLPISALGVGLIYDRRKSAAWWKSMLTCALGWAIIAIGLSVVTLIIGAISSGSNSDYMLTLGTAGSFLGCLSWITIVLLTFPTAAIEGIFHAIIVSKKARAKKNEDPK